MAFSFRHPFATWQYENQCFYSYNEILMYKLNATILQELSETPKLQLGLPQTLLGTHRSIG